MALTFGLPLEGRSPASALDAVRPVTVKPVVFGNPKEVNHETPLSLDPPSVVLKVDVHPVPVPVPTV